MNGFRVYFLQEDPSVATSIPNTPTPSFQVERNTDTFDDSTVVPIR